MKVFVLVLAIIFSFQADALTKEKKIYIGLGVGLFVVVAAGFGWYVYDTNRIQKERYKPVPMTEDEKKTRSELERILRKGDLAKEEGKKNFIARYPEMVDSIVARLKVSNEKKNQVKKNLLALGELNSYGFENAKSTTVSGQKVSALYKGFQKLLGEGNVDYQNSFLGWVSTGPV
ncbi:MAG: hypothetical protein OXE99_08210 [Cellvibrionales bacterium]|nr:hypothetical protein [Cellvibrionales bacterium]